MDHAVLSTQEALPSIALALAVGLLIGIERGWRMREEPTGARVAGVRTFALIGLLGGFLGLLFAARYASLAALLGGGAILALLLGYAADMRQEKVVSATSTIAAVITLSLGCLAGLGYHALASVGAGATVLLLASRKALHGAISEAGESDIKALVRLAVVIFLILPLLPDINIGPYGGINPRRLWLVVVTVGSISFAGYVLTRWLGTRGTLLSAIVGATVSSTAITIASANRMVSTSRQLSEQAAVVAASAVMLARTLVLVAALAPFILPDVVRFIAPALLFAAGTAALMAWMTRQEQPGATKTDVRAPGLGLAFLFASLVGLMSIAAAWAEQSIGEGGGAAIIAIGGMVDVDSAVAAIGAMPREAVSPRLAALAVAVPVAFNTLLKLVLMLSIAGPRRSKWAALNLLATAAIVAAATVFVLT